MTRTPTNSPPGGGGEPQEGGPWRRGTAPPPRGVALLLVTGAIQFVLFGCLGGFALSAGEAQLDEMKQALKERATTPEEKRVVESIDRAVFAAALGMLAVIALPGLILVLLGAAARRGSRTASSAAMAILWVQIAVVGLITLLSLPGLITARAPSSVLSLLPMAALLVLMVMTVRRLRAGGAPAVDVGGRGPGSPDPDEPWNAR